MLVFRQLLEAEALVVGDVVRLSAEESGDGARPFRIVGVYEPTPDPLRITGRRLEARLHLPDLIDLTADPAGPCWPSSGWRPSVPCCSTCCCCRGA